MRIFFELYSKNIDCYPQINPKFHNSNKLPNLFLSTPTFYRRKKTVRKKKQEEKQSRVYYPARLFKKQYKSNSSPWEKQTPQVYSIVWKSWINSHETSVWNMHHDVHAAALCSIALLKRTASKPLVNPK